MGLRTLYADEPRPKYCSKCGLLLEERVLEATRYDIYRGNLVDETYLLCPKISLNIENHHDAWELELVEEEYRTMGA